MMIIHNRETNNLKLVETLQPRGRIDLFMRTFSTSDYCSLEVFRDERHLASITPENTNQRWNPGMLVQANTILKVNRSSRIVVWETQLQTIDYFTRLCRIEVRLHVEDTPTFAIQYRHHSDPIALARRAAEALIQRDAQQRLHNDLSNLQLFTLAGTTFSDATRNRSGVIIDEILRVDLQLDPNYNRIVRGQQEEMVDDARMAREQRHASYEFRLQQPLQRERDAFELEREQQAAIARREEEQRQKEHEIRLEEMQQEHERRQNMLQSLQNNSLALQESYIRSISQAIQDQMEKGYTLREIWDEHPELRSAFQNMPQLASGNPGVDPRRALPPPGRNPSPSFTVKEHRPSSTGNISQRSVVNADPARPGSVDDTCEIIEVRPQPDTPRDASEPIFKVKSVKEPQTAPENNSSPPTSSVQSTRPSLNQATQFQCEPLGLTLSLITEEERLIYDLDVSTMFFVQAVVIDGAAHKGRLVRGDFILAINGQPVSDMPALTHLLQASTGSPITIRVLRQGQLYNLSGIMPASV